MLFEKESMRLAMLAGVTAGVTAIFSNYLGIVTLTGVFSGIMVAIVLSLYAKFQGYNLMDNSKLSDEEKEIEKRMSIFKAISPWLLLVLFSLLTNLINPIFNLLFNELSFPITIGPYIVKLRLFWQAYTWVGVSLILSFIFLPSGSKILFKTVTSSKRRIFKPMIATAMFFAIAWVLNKSSPDNVEFNMVYVLATFTSDNFAIIFPLLVPFIGLFGGFISGSEASSIAMFTTYHTRTASNLGLDPITLGTSNGIGGGLASVLSPAKVQNAAATIDQIGIEGDVLRKTIGISLAMTSVLAVLTFIWAKGLPILTDLLVLVLLIGYLFLVVSLFLFGRIFARKNRIGNLNETKVRD